MAVQPPQADQHQRHRGGQRVGLGSVDAQVGQPDPGCDREQQTAQPAQRPAARVTSALVVTRAPASVRCRASEVAASVAASMAARAATTAATTGRRLKLEARPRDGQQADGQEDGTARKAASSPATSAADQSSPAVATGAGHRRGRSRRERPARTTAPRPPSGGRGPAWPARRWAGPPGFRGQRRAGRRRRRRGCRPRRCVVARP